MDTPASDGQRSDETPAALSAVAALADSTRRALYRYVRAQSAPVTREQAAAALGIAHHAARFHLERLHTAGLLEVDYQRPEGRGGPGAGHPTKRYRPTATEFAVSVPERRYDLAGLVLTRALATAIDDGSRVVAALEQAAGDAGHALGRQARPAGVHPHRRRAGLAAAIEALDACGFEPRPNGDGYVLGNCPFRVLAQDEPEVVCGMNRALVAGLLEEVGASTATAQRDPAEGRCCVTVVT